MLKIKNGETVMIGGLLRNSTKNSISKLPILGDIPLVGAAFRHKEQTVSERELIIFITPYILDSKNKQETENKKPMRITREVMYPENMEMTNQSANSTEKSY